MQMPGWANIWTQPIINRIDMLATGVRTDDRREGLRQRPGQDPEGLRRGGRRAQARSPARSTSFPTRAVGKGYLEITIDREKAARYGVNVGDIQDVIEVALGGKAITMTVEGRERFPVRIRYARASREDEEDVKNLLVNAGRGDGDRANAGGGNGGRHGRRAPSAAGVAAPVQIPLSMVADVQIVEGPAMIKSENGMLRSYVQLNVRDRDIVGFVEEAQRVVAQKVKLPQGMYLEWSGQFENQVRARKTHAGRLPGGRSW